MSGYYLPDITGQDPSYLQTNIPYAIYQNGIKIGFENSPIFVRSLIIRMTDGTGRTLDKDVDWEVKPDDIDYTAMSRAFLENNQFTETLVKSVTVKSTKALGKAVAMTFQQFYLTNPGRTFDDGTPLELTPDLIKSTITGLADVRQQIARVQSPVAPNQVAPALLPFDVDGVKSSNLITNEQVTVNTIAGAKIIRLSYGSFFKDSLTLRYNGNLLTSQDYTPIVVSSLTDKSRNKSGIYEFIKLNGSFAGVISVDYHAVGGTVQPADINAVYQLMVGVRDFLNNGIFVTSDTIVETPAFRSMHSRQTKMEENVRRLLSGTPTYGDATSNNATTRPIAATDANIHWFTIATLYKVQGSNDIIRADQFKGRIHLPDSKISLAFTLDLNIDQTRQKASFKTDTLIIDPNYTLFTDLSVTAPQYPLVRVVWNQSPDSYSGACIQIGVPLPSLADRMVVEDLSSAESCWILSRKNEFILGQVTTPASTPDDNGFVLPDGVNIWSDASSISKSEVYVPKLDDGYLAYTGSTVTLNNLVTVNSTAASFNILLPKYFPIRRIKTLVVTIASADASVVYDVRIPITGILTNERYGRLVFTDSGKETLNMTAAIKKDAGDNITISLNLSEIAPDFITGTVSPKTDIIRYLRVEV